MSKIGDRRLLALATFLDERVPRKRFDMILYAAVENYFHLVTKIPPPEVDCGTSACALGWQTVLTPRTWMLDEWGTPVLRRGSTGDPYYDAAKFFDITHDQALALFGTAYATPKQKAKEIRAFVARRQKERE